MIPEVKLSDKATIKQKKDAIKALIEKSTELQREIKVLEKKRNDVKKGISDILDEKRGVLEKKTGEIDAKIEASKVLSKNLKDSLVEAIKKKDDLTEKTKEVEGLKTNYSSTLIKVKKDFLSKSIALDKRELTLKSRESVVSGKERLVEDAHSTISDEYDVLDKKEKEINAKLAEFEVSQQNALAREEDIRKQDAAIDIKMSKVLRLSASLDQKQAELIDKKKSLDAQSCILEAMEEKIKEKKEDVALQKKRNSAEAIRLSGLERDIVSRSAKLTEKENLFKEEIGG